MEDFVEKKTNAGIIWTLTNIQSNFSLKSNESLPKLFQSEFPDSAIGKNFRFRKDVYIT